MEEGLVKILLELGATPSWGLEIKLGGRKSLKTMGINVSTDSAAIYMAKMSHSNLNLIEHLIQFL